MKYTKPSLTREQQADLLISRGMMGDRDHIVRQLSAMNYYCVSGYWHTFRLLPAHDFSTNTTFDKVWTFQNRMSNLKQRSSSTAAEKRHDVATGAGLWNATMVDISAAERRHVVAMGASPWIVGDERKLSPNGTAGIAGMQRPSAPLGLGWMVASVNHGLAPVATSCRPFGTKTTEQMPRLVDEPHAQFAESAKLEKAIKANPGGLGYGK